MPQQNCKILNTGKPMDMAKVELCDDEHQETGKEIEVPSLLYFKEGSYGVVNDFTPDPTTGLKPGQYLTATDLHPMDAARQ